MCILSLLLIVCVYGWVGVACVFVNETAFVAGALLDICSAEGLSVAKDRC